MVELAKIQRISEQWNIPTPILTNIWHVFVINKETLNMPVVTGVAANEKLPTSGANYDVTYFVNVTALSLVGGIVGSNGVKTQKASLSWSNTQAELLPNPLPVSQVNESFIGSEYFNIYIIGNSSQIPPASGSPSITDNEINIALRSTTSISEAKIKLFVEIYSFGDTTI